MGESQSVIGLVDHLVSVGCGAGGPVSVLLTTGNIRAKLVVEPQLPAGAVCRVVPADVYADVEAFLDQWQPAAGIWIESELWPNLITATADRAIPMGLLNARMSPRSFGRWQSPALRAFAAQLVGEFQLILCQSPHQVHMWESLRAGVKGAALGAQDSGVKDSNSGHGGNSGHGSSSGNGGNVGHGGQSARAPLTAAPAAPPKRRLSTPVAPGCVLFAGDLKATAPPLPVSTDDLAVLQRATYVINAVANDGAHGVVAATAGRQRPVWVAMSTHSGEEEQVARVHCRLVQKRPALVDLLTVIVPRHPERAPGVEGRLRVVCAAEAARTLPGAKLPGVECGITLRSRERAGQGQGQGQGQPQHLRAERGRLTGSGDCPSSLALGPGTGIYIADTLGEAGLFYRLAGLALVGGSLVPGVGGHNALEAMRLQCAPLLGPLRHVPACSGMLHALGALGFSDAVRHVDGEDELEAAVGDLLCDGEALEVHRARARGAAEALGEHHLDQILAAVRPWLEGAVEATLSTGRKEGRRARVDNMTI
jgi:3-deoxy-D-manno-octulosonic-acid transferase